MAAYEPTSGRSITLCCVTCEKPFEHTTKNKGRYPRFCSDTCRAAKYRWLTEQKGQRTGPAVLTCRQCSQPFTSKDPKRKCCGTVCGGKWSKAQQNIWRRKRSIERTARTCQRCGAAFNAQRPSDPGKFCSKVCSNVGRRVYANKTEARRAEKMRAKARRRVKIGLDQPVPCARCQKPFVRKSLGHRFCCPLGSPPRKPKTCRICGEHFIPSNGNAIFCGDKCARRSARIKFGKRHRQRARYHGVAYEPVNRLTVFERDGWRCQVCGKKTPRKHQGTIKPNAPELDHRIPMAMGGAHSYENCQLACRACNLAKAGDRTVGQLPLFAKPAGVPRKSGWGRGERAGAVACAAADFAIGGQNGRQGAGQDADSAGEAAGKSQQAAPPNE